MTMYSPAVCLFVSVILLLAVGDSSARRRRGGELTHDCRTPSGPFQPQATFKTLFTRMCSGSDGKRGGCTSSRSCRRYGGSSVSSSQCSSRSQKCCLFEKRETKISERTCFCMEPKYCTGGTFSGLCPNSRSAKCCADETSQLSSCPGSEAISFSEFTSIFSSLSNSRAVALWPYINSALSDLTSRPTCHMKSAFLAQVYTETGGLLYTEEHADGSAYENRADLGNNRRGDGPRFKGRGFLQLTGRSNYNSFKSESGENVISDPEVVTLSEMSYRSAAWFWDANNLNQYADGTLLGFHRLVEKVNGYGMNHLDERVDKWKSNAKILDCPRISAGTGDNCDRGWGSCMVATSCDTEIRPKCSGRACCPKDPKTVKCCKKRR